MEKILLSAACGLLFPDTGVTVRTAMSGSKATGDASLNAQSTLVGQPDRPIKVSSSNDR
jgi:hypothetical protein